MYIEVLYAVAIWRFPLLCHSTHRWLTYSLVTLNWDRKKYFKIKKNVLLEQITKLIHNQNVVLQMCNTWTTCSEDLYRCAKGFHLIVSLSLSSLLSRVSDSRVSVLSHSEEDNRISKKNRKEWSMSKSQVLLERPADTDEVPLYLFLLFMAVSGLFTIWNVTILWF